MRFTIHDVAHGQLITLSAAGQLWMWDCGATEGHAPLRVAQQYGRGIVNLLFLTHFDEDHVLGLPELRRGAKIPFLNRNRSISGHQLRQLKLNSGYPISNSMSSVIDMIDRYTGSVDAAYHPSIPGVRYRTFHNRYLIDALDTNNISTVTILEANGAKIVISSDVEAEGWELLLARHGIGSHLADTDIFIASHHGRENGYHDEVMKIASPRCVVMSDYEVRHSTQEKMVGRYSKHTRGLIYGEVRRQVLTTRSDGHISWDI